MKGPFLETWQMIKDGNRNTKTPQGSSRIKGRNDRRLTRVKMRNSDGPYCHSMERPKCSLGKARLIKYQISSFLSYSKHFHLCFLWKNRGKIASSASSSPFPWCWALWCRVDNIYCQPDTTWSHLGTSGMEFPLSDWPVGVFLGHHLGCWLMWWPPSYCGWCHTWVCRPGLYRKC